MRFIPIKPQIETITYKWQTPPHFGDMWIQTNWLLRISEQTRTISRISCPPKFVNRYQEIKDNLASKGTLLITNEPANRIIPSSPDLVYKIKYYPTKIAWKSKKYKQICYQFDGIWRASLKNPKPDDLKIIMKFLESTGFKLVRLGLPHSITRDIEIASRSDFFVGIDSGMSHVCHSVGVPMYLIEYGMPVDIYHAGKQYIKCIGTKDCIDKVKIHVKNCLE
jgi:hypothetical protein